MDAGRKSEFEIDTQNQTLVYYRNENQVNHKLKSHSIYLYIVIHISIRSFI